MPHFFLIIVQLLCRSRPFLLFPPIGLCRMYIQKLLFTENCFTCVPEKMILMTHGNVGYIRFQFFQDTVYFVSDLTMLHHIVCINSIYTLTTMCSMFLIGWCQVGAVIVTPTRELAIQIDEVIAQFVVNLPQFTHSCLIGGNNPANDVEKFIANGSVTL
jgi:hypothetical protein